MTKYTSGDFYRRQHGIERNPPCHQPRADGGTALGIGMGIGGHAARLSADRADLNGDLAMRAGGAHLKFEISDLRWWKPGVDPATTARQSVCPSMATQTSTSLPGDPVKQFSVYTENRVGRLFDLAKLLKAHDVHIIAITTIDTTDSAIVRLVVDDPDKARELMVNNDFPYTECDVTAVEIDGEADLKAVLSALLEAEINIHYVYSFINRPKGKSALLLNIEDADIAAQSLTKRGLKVLFQRDISR